jgi:small subunit ribosomal protein S16
MVVIRLARGGSKNRPFYSVVVADQRKPRDGKNIERVGTYNPLTKAVPVQLQMDRINHWIGVGAQPSPRVAYLMKQFAAQPGAALAN